MSTLTRLTLGLEEPSGRGRCLGVALGIPFSPAVVGFGGLGQLSGGLERMSRGEKPTPDGVDWTDIQDWNDTFAHHAVGKRRPEVLSELDHALRTFEEAAAKLPSDCYEEGKTASKMFDLAGISHFKEHAAVIRALREGRVLKV